MDTNTYSWLHSFYSCPIRGRAPPAAPHRSAPRPPGHPRRRAPDPESRGVSIRREPAAYRVSKRLGLARARSAGVRARDGRADRVPADGSSRARICGRIESTVARAIRLRWPMLSRCGMRSSKPLMPTCARAVRTRSCTWSGGRFIYSGPNATSSNTVGENSWSLGSWKTRPTQARTRFSVRRVSAVPAILTAPSSPPSAPLRCSSNVDLPAPFGPTSASFSPASMFSEIPSSARRPSG